MVRLANPSLLRTRLMKTIVIFLAVLLVAGGGAYLLAAPDAPDPEAQAMAEALALHTRAVKAALEDECGEARDKLDAWHKLRKAGTPDPNDTKQARKTLRQMIKGGCRDNG